MAHAQALRIEIQYLKDALVASQRKSDQYAQLVTTLSDELDELRKNICYDCKMKLIPGSVSVHAPSTGLNPFTTAYSTSAPFSPRKLPSQSPIDNTGPASSAEIPSAIPTISLNTVEAIPDTTALTPATSHDSDPISISPEFSAVYNSEVKRALDFRLEHVIAHESPAFCTKLSPDGQRIAVGFSRSGKTILDEAKTRSNVRVFVDRYHDVQDHLTIWSVRFSPDGRLIATGANDHQIRIWDIAQNRMRAMFKRHKNEVNSVAFSPDGLSLVSGSDDRSVCIWNIRDGSSKLLPVTDPGFFVSVVFSPDGRYIAAGDLGNWLRIWASRTRRVVAKWRGHTDCVWCVEFTPDGKGLMSGGTDNTVKYWDVSSLRIHEAESGKEAATPGQSFPLIRIFSGHTDRVRSIAFFPSSSEWVITSSDDSSVRVWDIRTGVWQLMLQGHTKSVQAVAVSGRENFLATAGVDCHVTLWRYEVF